MGFLRTDYSNTDRGFVRLPPIPIGEYECIISYVRVVKSQSGYDMLKLALTIRDDVPQRYQKHKLFDYVVAKETTMWKFNAIAKAAGIPAGQEFATIGDFAKAILYKPVRVKNKHEEYNGFTQDRIDYYMESEVQAPAAGSPAGDSFAVGGTLVNVSDDELPF